MKGLFMHLSDGLHTYGIQAINDAKIYDKLRFYFFNSGNNNWFLQGDSMMTSKDKSWLFIEFLNVPLNDSTALALCEKIAKDIGEHLQI